MGARTTSTSCMSGTGLKKWSPTKRVGRLVAAAISVIDSEDVFEAKMAVGATTASRAANTSRLAARFSIAASITRSRSAKSASCVVPWMRAWMAVFCSAVSLPFSTPPARNFSMRARPLASAASSTSRTRTSKPACAATCTIPEPMRPQPTTPTFWIAMNDISPLEVFALGPRYHWTREGRAYWTRETAVSCAV